MPKTEQERQEQNLRNEIITRVEDRMEEHREQEMLHEDEHVAHEEMEHEQELDRMSVNSFGSGADPSRPSVHSSGPNRGEQPNRPDASAQQFMAQGYTPEQARWLEGMQAFRRHKEQEQQAGRNAQRAKNKQEEKEKAEDKKIKEKRRRRNQEYDARIKRGGPGAIWAALKKFVMETIVDNVTDLARGTWRLAKSAAGAAKDAITGRYVDRAEKSGTPQVDAQLREQAEMLSFMAEHGYLGRQNAPQARQPAAAQPRQEQPAREPQMAQPEVSVRAESPVAEQPAMQGSQPEVSVRAESPVAEQPAMQEPQPQAMPRAVESSLSFADQRDILGKKLNGLDNMCRSAGLITGQQPSRRDLSVALACMHDPKVSGMSAGQSRFESEKIMKFLSGEQLGPQDGPINQDLLKKGLDAARQPGALEREGFLGAMQNLSRVISRAPSLDAPHRMAAGEALDEIAKECAHSNKPDVKVVGMMNTEMTGNVNANKALRQIAEIRGAVAFANIYRQGKQAQYDELDRVAQMQERGINPDAHRMSKDNLSAIVMAESINDHLAQRMTRERIKLNQQQEVSRRVDDIAKMPMPNPMTMRASKTMAELGKDPHLLDQAWEQSIGTLRSVQEMQNGPAVRVLEDMEKNRGAIAERMSSDIREIKETEKRQHEEEKRREREPDKQNEKQNGKGMSA